MKRTIAIESLANLWCDVCQVECLVHGLLAVCGVRGRDHVAAIEAALEVIRQSGPELERYALILFELRFAAIGATTC